MKKTGALLKVSENICLAGSLLENSVDIVRKACLYLALHVHGKTSFYRYRLLSIYLEENEG